MLVTIDRSKLKKRRHNFPRIGIYLPVESMKDTWRLADGQNAVTEPVLGSGFAIGKDLTLYQRIKVTLKEIEEIVNLEFIKLL